MTDFTKIIDKANNENSIINQKFIGEDKGNISLKKLGGVHPHRLLPVVNKMVFFAHLIDLCL